MAGGGSDGVHLEAHRKEGAARGVRSAGQQGPFGVQG